jgi:hypothetical protein
MLVALNIDGRLANRRLERTSTSVRLSSLTYTYDNRAVPKKCESKGFPNQA